MEIETINIINNFDSKILMENLLITNQSKLLDTIIKIFGTENISNKELGEFNPTNVKDYLNKQKFINWELFINLINLDFTFYLNKKKFNSLSYIVKSKSYKLVEFLLDLTLKNYQTNQIVNQQIVWSDVFVDVIKQMYSNDNIINKLIDLVLIDDRYKKLLNTKIHNNKTTLFYFVSKCSETIILRLIETKLINLDWEDDYSNGLVHWACKRNLVKLFELVNDNNLNMDNKNKGEKSPLHLACIKNNISLVKLLINNKVDIGYIDLESNAPINYAIKYGKTELVKLLLDENISFNDNYCDSVIFYQIIKYQNEEMINYFIDKKFIDINKTSWIWPILLFGSRSMYSQIVEYYKKKTLSSIVNYYNNICKFCNYDLFDDDGEEMHFYRF